MHNPPRRHFSELETLTYTKMIKLSPSLICTFIFFLSWGHVNINAQNIDTDILEFPLNLEYLEAEFFLWGALGYGLDRVEPSLADGGPPPFGARIANLDPFTRDLITEFAYQEVGHIKAIKDIVEPKGFPRPAIDISDVQFGNIMNKAVGRTLVPPFSPYVSTTNFLLAAYMIPYVGLTGYVGINSKIQDSGSKRLVAGLLAVESGQDAVIRTILYQRAKTIVVPYGITVAEFTNLISNLRNSLGKVGVKDEGILVPREQGAEGKVVGNVIAGDNHSLGYERFPREILRVVYGSGNESMPGGFFPNGADGKIAKSYLDKD